MGREKELKLFKSKAHLGLSAKMCTCTGLNSTALSTVQQENTGLRKQIEEKNTQIHQFRCELDALLEMLKVLQKQGVVIGTEKLR